MVTMWCHCLGVMWNIVYFQIDFVLHSLPEAFAEVKQRADKAYVHLCVCVSVCLCMVCVYVCVCELAYSQFCNG